MYIELHAASAFSFLEAASDPEALVARAAALGYPALAVLDRDGVYGAPRTYMAAKAAGLKAIVGAELTMRALPPGSSTSMPRPPFLWRLPVLVASRVGYRHLCRLITRMKLRSDKGEGALTLEELEGSTEGLIAFGGRALLSGAAYGVGGLLERLVGLFGPSQVYVELQRHYLRDEEADNQALLALAAAYRVPVLATNGVRFATPAERPLFDTLTCIRHKTTLARAGQRLARNAEHYVKSPAEMAALFADLPSAVHASGELVERLDFTMRDLGYRFPDYPMPPGETMTSFLRHITAVGARERFRPLTTRAQAQLTRELDLIEKLDLAGYFLIVWDIVNFCRQQGILVQGRGSAANSAVCYSLGITAIDPVKMELLFERFLSEERGEWPDIDLDLPSGERREQVIQYVYQRYGPLGAAMTANVITYRGRSAAREVGKALGLDPASIDRLAKLIHHFEWRDPQETWDRYLRDLGEDPQRPMMQTFADLWRRIQHLPRHLGQHSGGMVMCQGRLDDVVPLENASMPGRVVIQWDKEDCADMGIVKVDLLGLGMMAAMQDALSLVNHRLERAAESSDAAAEACLDLSRVPANDPAVYRMLQEADTVGIFQVESRAQMATLPRLKPACFYDIVVEVALIRPGPIVGQMVHPYLRRRAGREPVSYAHPSLEPILARTLGVPLFQEQLLRMAMTVAGFSGGEAEELRRAMGFKRSEERMRQIEGRLRAGMARQGIVGETAEAIVRSISSFALYGFPESHAASFALIVYASAYLKAHYPAAFYTALLNNQPMGFYHPATLVKDAQRHGVRFASVDVQVSEWLCTVEEDGTVRLGLMMVRGLRRDVGEAIARTSKQMVRLMSGAPRTRRVTEPSSVEVAGVRRVEAKESPADPRCPKCGCDDPSMLETVQTTGGERWFCSTCAHDWGTVVEVPARQSRAWGRLDVPVEPEVARERPGRFLSLDHLVAVTGIRREELATLAEIGALNAFGYDRRSALWQIERAMRPAGALFDRLDEAPVHEGATSGDGPQDDDAAWADVLTEFEQELHVGELGKEEGAAFVARDPLARDRRAITDALMAPLPAMTLAERVLADYSGTGLTIGPHPMALRRAELALRGVLRSSDLPKWRHGRRVRVAGAVITRQRPGTAKGFVFLTLEDETGIANVIVQPDLFDSQRVVIVNEPFVVVEGVLQIQEGVTSVKADRIVALAGAAPVIGSHDFQ